jgi:hypothetical protein
LASHNWTSASASWSATAEESGSESHVDQGATFLFHGSSRGGNRRQAVTLARSSMYEFLLLNFKKTLDLSHFAVD